jgi:hypothetical protein
MDIESEDKLPPGGANGKTPREQARARKSSRLFDGSRVQIIKAYTYFKNMR